MNIIEGYTQIPTKAKGSVLALGNFDGVHKGHQAIIKRTVEIARKCNKPSAVVTFEPHPVSVFKPDIEDFRLTDVCKKSRLIAELSVDYMFVINFNNEFSNMSAGDFIKHVLLQNLCTTHVVIGYDFIFGKDRGGNAELLQKEAQPCGFMFTQLSAAKGDAGIYSSTQIRNYLKKADLEHVKLMLGRNYAICGQVERGDQRGRQLGFPTININTNIYLLPKAGVYACKLQIENDKNTYNAVANIGTRPTFEGESMGVEVHIFNFDKEIYGANVELELISYVRKEEHFETVDMLVEQITKDCVRVKELLG